MKDTTGLKTFYERNKSNYMWGDRIDADIYECYSKESADKAAQLAKLDTLKPVEIVQKINDNSELNIRHRNGKFDLNKTAYLKGKDFKKGLNNTFEDDGKFYVIVVKEKLVPSQKEFAEAKGAITSDYQNFLEKNWLAELNKKHAISVNEDELYSIGK